MAVFSNTSPFVSINSLPSVFEFKKCLRRLEFCDIHLGTKGVGLGSIADPEVGVRTCTVVVKVGDIECLGVKHADVAGAQAVRQAPELGQDARPRRLQPAWDEHVAEVHLNIQFNLYIITGMHIISA